MAYVLIIIIIIIKHEIKFCTSKPGSYSFHPLCLLVLFVAHFYAVM